MKIEETNFGETGVQKYPVSYNVKVNEVCVFEKKFALNGFKYNAIVLREDGALVMFDYDECGVIPQEEE